MKWNVPVLYSVLRIRNQIIRIRQVDPDTDKSRSWQVGKIISTEIFFFKNKKIIDAKSEMNEIADTVK